MGKIKAHLQRKFLAGTLAAVPVVVTAFIVWYVDSQVRALVEVKIPFVGIAVAIVGIYALGVFVSSLFGRYLLRLLDRLLTRLPGFHDLYQTWKQIAITPDADQGMFARVVLIPDESGKSRMMGFTTARPIEGSDTACVFVPASPNPLTGRLFFVRNTDCIVLPIGAKDALKILVSGGNYVPAAVGAALFGKVAS